MIGGLAVLLCAAADYNNIMTFIGSRSRFLRLVAHRLRGPWRLPRSKSLSTMWQDERQDDCGPTQNETKEVIPYVSINKGLDYSPSIMDELVEHTRSTRMESQEDDEIQSWESMTTKTNHQFSNANFTNLPGIIQTLFFLLGLLHLITHLLKPRLRLSPSDSSTRRLPSHKTIIDDNTSSV